jgi:hypothetical protein
MLCVWTLWSVLRSLIPPLLPRQKITRSTVVLGASRPGITFAKLKLHDQTQWCLRPLGFAPTRSKLCLSTIWVCAGGCPLGGHATNTLHALIFDRLANVKVATNSLFHSLLFGRLAYARGTATDTDTTRISALSLWKRPAPCESQKKSLHALTWDRLLLLVSLKCISPSFVSGPLIFFIESRQRLAPALSSYRFALF